MKKLLCFFMVLLVLVGCSSEPSKTLTINGIQSINYEELTQNLNSNVKFILYIGRPDCGDCQQFYPTLEEYINTHKNTGIYYLNIKEFRDNAKKDNASDEEKKFYENLQKTLDFDWTPTIEVIENGKIKKSYQYLDEDYFNIQDREKQKQRRQEFLDEFESFMDDYFKEN